VVFWTQPNNHTLSFLIDLSHEPNLHGLLVVIYLVNAELVYPQAFGVRLADHVWKGFGEVGREANLAHSILDSKSGDTFGFAPGIGDGFESR
jgi:hypothetical protein